MTTSTVVYESELGTFSRIEDNGVFTGLKIIVHPAVDTPGWVALVNTARDLGYTGRLQTIDFRADGSESWVIYPELDANPLAGLHRFGDGTSFGEVIRAT